MVPCSRLNGFPFVSGQPRKNGEQAWLFGPCPFWNFTRQSLIIGIICLDFVSLVMNEFTVPLNAKFDNVFCCILVREMNSAELRLPFVAVR